jgi:hypothetical protein
MASGPRGVNAFLPQSGDAGRELLTEPVGSVDTDFSINHNVERRRRIVSGPIESSETVDDHSSDPERLDLHIFPIDSRHFNRAKAISSGEFVRGSDGNSTRAVNQVGAPVLASEWMVRATTLDGKLRRAESAISLLKAR